MSSNGVGNWIARQFRLVDNSDESWRRYGRDDPYFGVLSDDRFRAANLTEQSLNDFFASGEQHVIDVLDTVQLHVSPNLAMQDALDFGCGVGRLVLPLAARFHSVTGVDISDAYIAEAVRNAGRKGLTNIQFAEHLDDLVGTVKRFDLVHSYIVFNHIPWQRGKDIIVGLFGLLRQNGVLAVQILHRRRAGPGRRAISWARRNFLPLHWGINISRRRPVFEPLMQGNEYPLDELLPLLHVLGARHFHIRVEPAQGGDSFAFIFCQKTAGANSGGNPENI